LVFSTAPDERGEAFDGFQIVVEHVGHAIEAEFECKIAVVEIWGEDFDNHAGVECADGFDDKFEVLGSAVAEVITADGGDDDVFEFESLACLGDALGFGGVQGIGAGSFNGAESAGSGAFFTGNHKGGGALAPAFPAVRAVGLFTDGDEVEVGDERFGGTEFRAVREAHFEPFGLTFDV